VRPKRHEYRGCDGPVLHRRRIFTFQASTEVELNWIEWDRREGSRRFHVSIFRDVEGSEFSGGATFSAGMVAVWGKLA
jgi:hypothetical protein